MRMPYFVDEFVEAPNSSALITSKINKCSAERQELGARSTFGVGSVVHQLEELNDLSLCHSK